MLIGTFLIIVLILLPLFFAAVHISSARPKLAPNVQPQGPIATDEELLRAREQWSETEHARTYDEGLGANTTCARCKSPLNWDPSQDAAAQQALDCGSCKRVPGAPRPELEGGIPVSEDDWQHITCDICHIPVGDSYHTDIAYWNQSLGQYEAVENVMELCA